MTSPSTEVPVTYSQIACVGAGLSAVALGATLQRWYGLEDIVFFERHPTTGGTWYINTYPGQSETTQNCKSKPYGNLTLLKDAAAMSQVLSTVFPLLKTQVGQSLCRLTRRSRLMWMTW
jgi:hypothetical protein